MLWFIDLPNLSINNAISDKISLRVNLQLGSFSFTKILFMRWLWHSIFFNTRAKLCQKRKTVVATRISKHIFFPWVHCQTFLPQNLQSTLGNVVFVHSTKTHQNLSHSWDQNEPQATITPINTCNFNHV